MYPYTASSSIYFHRISPLGVTIHRHSSPPVARPSIRKSGNAWHVWMIPWVCLYSSSLLARRKDTSRVLFPTGWNHQNIENHQALEGFRISPWISDSRVVQALVSLIRSRSFHDLGCTQETNIYCCFLKTKNYVAAKH